MQELHAALLALQEIDEEIRAMQERVDEFTPRIEALTAPADALQRELDQLQAKLQEMRSEQERLERNAQQKDERLKAAQERLAGARNPREESAFHAEVDLIRRALEADREDLRMVSEQATRTDLKLDDLRRSVEAARGAVAEQQQELLDARAELDAEMAVLRERRENQAIRIDEPARRLYERMRTGRFRRILAQMTEEGACGNCYNILPLQERTVVRRGDALHRCEGCGVILYVE